MKLMETEQLFQQMRAIKVAVVGDVMLDTYWWGSADRISPEAPVPVVTLERTEYRIGGAANVALNVRALTDQVALLSVIGSDREGALLLSELEQRGISRQGILIAEDRKTTCKTRVISRNQQMIRLDHETKTDLSEKDQEAFITNCRNYIEKEKPHVLIFEDYNKGVLTETVIRELISLCKKSGIFTAVDPKQKNFFAYSGADLFKPNLKEVREALMFVNEELNPFTLAELHEALSKRLTHQLSLITLSEKGVYYHSREHEFAMLPTFRRTIADVSGAGDTVIAVASLVYVTTKDPHLMALVANLAGGLVCEEVGTVPVNRERLMHEYDRLISSAAS